MMAADGVPEEDLDLVIMRQLAAVHTIVDPPPADLDERVLFVLDLEDLDVEVARQSEDLLVGSGARASERTRTITFEADSRAVMITVADQADDLLRIDGWLAPGAALRVELRAPEPVSSRTVTADEGGRFVFDEVPHGLVQLVVHPPQDSDNPRVVTPSLML
jgi:hypothetical protein